MKSVAGIACEPRDVQYIPLPTELVARIADFNVQTAAKLAQLSKTLNALIQPNLTKSKQRWKFNRLAIDHYLTKGNDRSPLLLHYGERDCLSHLDSFFRSVSVVKKVDQWGAWAERRDLLRAILRAINKASVVCTFANLEDHQEMLKKLYNEYRELLGDLEFPMYEHRPGHKYFPALFGECYAGRAVSSMRVNLLMSRFERGIQDIESQDYTKFCPFVCHVVSSEQYIQLIGGLMSFMKGNCFLDIPYVVQYIAMTTIWTLGLPDM